MNNCCCLEKVGDPCSQGNGIRNVFMGASFNNTGREALNGSLSMVSSNLFPNFTHDIKSFPADETSDYVAIAGGSYGCRVLKHTASGVTDFAHLIGSCSRITSRETYTVSLFGGMLQQEIWIGDENGYRYGYDDFRGIYGVGFFKKGGTTYLVTACGANGLDLWDLDSSSAPILLVSGAGAGVGIFKKVAIDKRLRIVCLSGGYEPMPDEYRNVGTDFWKMASQPEGSNPAIPQRVNNWYTSVWEINLGDNLATPPTPPGITSAGEFRFDADGSGGTVPSWTESGGGGNDIIYIPEDDIFVYSYSFHGWNIDHGNSNSPSRHADITNLVIGGGMHIITYDPNFDIYTDEPYHNHPCGQLSVDPDRNVYWANLVANASNNNPLVGINTSPSIRPASDFLEHLNGYSTAWRNHPERDPATSGCGFSDALEFYIAWEFGLTLYTFINGNSIDIAGKTDNFDCVYGNDLFDEDTGLTWTPLGPYNPQGTTSEQRLEYFGGGATGVSYCAGKDWVSLWQDGFAAAGDHTNSLDVGNSLINYDGGGGTSGRLYPSTFDNFAPTLPCGRSTASRFGVIITVSLENTHGDMGPGHYGFTTTGQGALKDAANLLQASDSYYGKTRGIIF